MKRIRELIRVDADNRTIHLTHREEQVACRNLLRMRQLFVDLRQHAAPEADVLPNHELPKRALRLTHAHGQRLAVGQPGVRDAAPLLVHGVPRLADGAYDAWTRQLRAVARGDAHAVPAGAAREGVHRDVDPAPSQGRSRRLLANHVFSTINHRLVHDMFQPSHVRKD
ncbi:hypothetical protein FGB62_49g213 [Gracilaria domingensis]|nr:hypothetical protein FGB62_49g213 [Gracilaria domingensis]